MNNSDIFRFPVFTIKKVKPLLSRDHEIFASEMKAKSESGYLFNIYENKGIDLTNYINVKMECLVEITRGRFRYKDNKGNLPENAVAFKYHWLIRPYEFLPELEKIKNELEDSNAVDEDESIQKFEKKALEFFDNWGLNGLNIDMYQAKPLLKSSIGIFLLNEYEFEEELEYLELNQEVYISIEELYLRGIRPNKSTIEQRREFIMPKQKDEKNETEKRRSFFG